MRRFFILLLVLAAAGAAVAGISPPYGWMSEPMTLDIESGTRTAAGAESLCLDAAKDVVGGTNLTMKTVWEYGKSATSSTSPYRLAPGNYRFMWNAGVDLPDGFESSRVTIIVEAK